MKIVKITKTLAHSPFLAGQYGVILREHEELDNYQVQVYDSKYSTVGIVALSRNQFQIIPSKQSGVFLSNINKLNRKNKNRPRKKAPKNYKPSKALRVLLPQYLVIELMEDYSHYKKGHRGLILTASGNVVDSNYKIMLVNVEGEELIPKHLIRILWNSFI